MRAIDAVNRADVIDMLEMYPFTEYGEYETAREVVKRLPSAQPETGYWISARDEDGRHMWLICSECRAKETNLKAKYCPVCGRKMA